MRCLALFTGGLDSLLSVRLMQAQGIEVIGLYVASPLCAADRERAVAKAADLGIELRTAELTEEYCRLLRAPRFGRIDSAAPCLDCRIAMFATAREFSAAARADFVISGEVVGQRPRTAARDLEVVAHHAGLGELLLRPLSARLLPPTEPEARAWIDRSRLMAIQGKSRKPQLELARSLGLANMPPPRPDCPLLAQPLAGRVQELLNDSAEIAQWLLALLPIGRHFRVDAHTRIILGRNRGENDALTAAAQQAPSDACSLATPNGFAGPIALIVGLATPAACDRAKKLVIEYGHTTGSPAESVIIRNTEVPIAL
jgi:Predicted tRNA(5-methylaminomethyl-2-thiouridylate) methyltransferase, contains the PP-loop ATPase domain